MLEHTKEPWRYDFEPGYCGELISADGKTIATFTDEPSDEDARRIVACVNACAGIDTAFLERTHSEGYESGFRKHIECERQRDQLLAAITSAERKLAAYVDVCTGDKELTDAVLPKVRAAIAKAKGGAT